MTLTLDLPPELEKRLSDEAARLGLSPIAYALEVLESGVPADALPTNGAELLAYWEREGVLGIWADRTDIADSAQYARELRDRAEHRAQN